jgi:Domain of unknown function (DUF4265)
MISQSRRRAAFWPRRLLRDSVPNADIEAMEVHEHVLVSVQEGSGVKEELAVAVVRDGTYRLVLPPAVTLGLAVGDVFTVDPATLRPDVLDCAGNITVWVYGTDEDIRPLADEVADLGGTFDGAAHGDAVFIFTIPVGATFPAIETAFNRFVERHPSSEWMFANVYGDDGVTPLGWWEAS